MQSDRDILEPVAPESRHCIEVTATPFREGERQNACGGEFGVTFFVHGIRVFIPNGTSAQAIGEAITALNRLMACDVSASQDGQLARG